MDLKTWNQFATFQSLLAIGVTLVVVGLILRGFATSNRRDLARRKQHRLDERRTGESSLNEQLERPPGWFEKNLGSVANLILVAGVVISVFAFLR